MDKDLGNDSILAAGDVGIAALAGPELQCLLKKRKSTK